MRKSASVALAGIALTIWLASCGGGSSTPVGPPPPPPPPPPPAAPDVSAVTASDPGSTFPANSNWQHGAFMEIFVRSYKDSDGDGKGDLRGVTSELLYLQALGVKGLWLMPVTVSSDHDHGYAVANYRDIDPDYGTLADLDDLLAQAHALGIGVVIDYVINHSSDMNPVFLNSRYATGNAYRDWYIWQATAPAGWNIYGGNPWRTTATGAYFGVFSPSMPDWNLNNPAVVAYHESNLRFWLNRGVDGFRFDAVGNLYENGPTAWEDQPQNYTLMMQVRALLSTYSQRYMVCEGPADPQGFAAATGCGAAFAFDLKGSLLGAARNDPASITALSNYFTTAQTGMATILANHDSFAGDRIWSQLGGDIPGYKLAAASYLLAPGTPFIYYGEEIGMAGTASTGGDAALRTPMSWAPVNTATDGFTSGTPYRSYSANVATENVAIENADPTSLLNFYREMLALRNARVSLRDGPYNQPLVTGSVLSYQRRIPGETTLVVINYGTTAASATIAGLGPNAALSYLYPPVAIPDVIADSGGTAAIPVAAQSTLVFDVSPAL